MSDASAARVALRWSKKAGYPPAPSEDGADLTSAGKRNIPKDHEFQARALKPLSKALWASTIALGHTLTAYRHLSRLKSTTVSPDGLMGGRGYVMKLADMRQKLYEASEALSAISDTMFDEINAPHWKPKLAQLDESDQEDVTRFVEEAQDAMENPEGDAEEEIEEIEAKSKGDDDEAGKSEGASASGLPLADAAQAESEVRGQDQPGRTKEASASRSWTREVYADAQGPVVAESGEVASAIYVVTPIANSSQPVSDLPGGPRVDHLGPGTGTGDYGDFNPSESPPHDAWSADGGGIARRDDSGEDYDYSSEWENDLSRAAAAKVPSNEEVEGWWEDSSPVQAKGLARALKLTTHKLERWNAHDWEKVIDYYVRTEEGDPRGYERGRNIASWKAIEASTSIPDSATDDTPIEAWDFGIGYGAHGQGAGGYANPSGEGNGTKGVWGPHSALPGSPPQSTGDTPAVLDVSLNRRARAALYGQLPQDVAGDVARSDYYSGAKDNEVTVGESSVPQPNTVLLGDSSTLPTPEDTRGESGQRLLNTYYTLDDVATPYERYDFTTHTLREPEGLSEGQNYQEPFAPGGEATR